MPIDLPRVELAGIAPELALAATALVLLVFDAFYGAMLGRGYLAFGATAGIAVAGWLALDRWGEAELQLADMIALDGFATFVKVTLLAFGLLTVWLGRDYLASRDLEEPEFYALVLFSLAGMMLMASAADLIVLFLALETFSIALYVLVGWRRRSAEGQEGALKYFLLGSFSSAFFLLGIALAYGAVGSTRLYGDAAGTPGIVEYLRTSATTEQGLLVLAAGLLTVGLFFKIAAVPFHMWTPDAYQGAPSPVTGFMAAGTKIAAFGAMLRLLDAVLFPLRWDWRPLVIVVAVATMAAGSVLAVVQEDVKRMLAYSSIAHAGFVLTGVLAATDGGVAGSLFYLATYGVSVLGAFGVVAVLGGVEERRLRLADYRGLFYSRPALASALTLFLLSLAGVPPTSGFVGKLLVFGAAVDAGYSWVAVVGVVTSAIAAFFYLRVLVVMYMQESEGEAMAPMAGLASYAVIALAAAATLVLGIVWGPLAEAAEAARMFFTA